jgi:hypothetical protein
MKTKTHNTKQAGIPTGCNFSSSISLATVNQAFKKAVGKTEDDCNDYLQKFIAVTERVMALMPTFSIHDIRKESLAFEIPEDELNRLFTLWSDQMITWCRLEKVEGCYNYPVYVRL